MTYGRDFITRRLTLSVGNRWNEEHQVHQQWQSGGDGGNSGAVPERGHAEEAVV